MGTKKKKINILDILDKVELELLQNNTSYAEHFLKEEGVNVVNEKAFARQYIKKIQFLTNAMDVKANDQMLLDKAVEKIKKLVSEHASLAKDALISLLHEKAPSVQFRKLDNWTDEEIREVLSDVDLVDLLEEFDND